MSDRIYFAIVFVLFLVWMSVGIYNNLDDISVFQPGIILGIVALLPACLIRLFYNFEEQSLPTDKTFDTFQQTIQRTLWPIAKHWRWYVSAAFLWLGYTIMDALNWDWWVALIIVAFLAVLGTIQGVLEFLVGAPFKYLMRYNWFKYAATGALLLVAVVVISDSLGKL